MDDDDCLVMVKTKLAVQFSQHFGDICEINISVKTRLFSDMILTLISNISLTKGKKSFREFYMNNGERK